MLTRPFVLFLCLVVCVGCLLGLYRLQAQPQPQEVPPTPQERPPPETEVAEPHRLLFSESIHSDFYQTIIRNNLFAPLGTVLNQKPVPGANLKLIATFTRDDPAKASAIVENIATGEQKSVGIGTVVGGYQVLDIQAKQILIEKEGERAVWKRMNRFYSTNKGVKRECTRRISMILTLN